jgi:hypothetical protein
LIITQTFCDSETPAGRALIKTLIRLFVATVLDFCLLECKQTCVNLHPHGHQDFFLLTYEKKDDTIEGEISGIITTFYPYLFP